MMSPHPCQIYNICCTDNNLPVNVPPQHVPALRLGHSATLEFTSEYSNAEIVLHSSRDSQNNFRVRDLDSADYHY